MSRPLDWAPLAERDPLPGDPDAILDEATRLRNTAVEISRQVDTLRKVGNTDLLGHYADALRDDSLDTATKLEKVADRYRTVATCLFGWAPELIDFQTATLRTLTKAQDAERQRGRDAHADLPPLFAYQANPLTADASDPATVLLAEARRELQHVLDQAEQRDRYWGHQIATAIDDDLTDGFWDHLHGVVHQAEHAFKELTDHLGYVTTAVALVSLAVPGLDLVVLGLMVATTVLDTKEAIEGGSWFDVGLDAVGLVSLGAGKLVISRALKGTMEATRAEAAAADGAEAAEAARRAGASARDAAKNALKEGSGASVAEKKEATKTIREFRRNVASARQGAIRKVEEAPLAEAKFRQVAFAGREEDVKMANTTKQLLSDHPGNEAVKNAARNLRRQVWAGRANFVGATTLDGAAKAADQAAERTSWSWAHSYRDFTERFTLSEGMLDEPATAP